jgi:hypothetical protein
MRILMMSLVTMFVTPAVTHGSAATGMLIARQQGAPGHICLRCMEYRTFSNRHHSIIAAAKQSPIGLDRLASRQ